MALTAQQANQALANVTTVDQLRNLINQLSIEASGKTTVLYSGATANGVDNSSVILVWTRSSATGNWLPTDLAGWQACGH